MQQQIRTTRIAAHRGSAGLWPENSMVAFENTTELDVDFVEFDVHPTRDGQLVVFHDPILDRMTNGSGPIADKTFEQLQKLTLTGTKAGRIPLLSSVLGVFKNTPINLRLEIKGDTKGSPYDGLEKSVAEMLVAHGVIYKTILASFLVEVLSEFNKYATPINRIWLVKREVLLQIGGIEPVLHIARQNGIEEIALHQSQITHDRIDRTHAAGIRIGGYAANDAESIQRMFDFALTVFTTDYPDIALRTVENSN